MNPKREILFRGKGKDGEGWKEGNYLFKQDTILCIASEEEQKAIEHHYIIFSGFCDWNMPLPYYRMEIIPETLGQYIGKKDKNKNKIFEGDYIQHSTGFIWVVKWVAEEGCFGYFYNDEYFLFIDEYDSEEFEIIGNIYDNPELIIRT